MSGNPHTPEIERAKREKRAAFQKEMDKYNLRVSPTVAVLATSYPNTVNLCVETETRPVRGCGIPLKQLKAAGYWVMRWREVEPTVIRKKNRITTVQRSYFKVLKIYMVTLPEESGVGL